MNFTKAILAGAALAASLAAASTAGATVIYWHYSSDTVNGSGQFDEVAGAIIDFSGTITSPLGTDSSLALIANPNGTSNYTTPDNRFIIDNAYPVDVSGIDISGALVPGGEYNLWSNLAGHGAAYSSGSATLDAGNVDGYPFTSNGTLTLSVPEPSTWAVMLIGLGGLGAAMRVGRRQKAATV